MIPPDTDPPRAEEPNRRDPSEVHDDSQEQPLDDPIAAAGGVMLDGFPMSADPEHLSARERLEVLASKFADRVRQGETPAIHEFTTRNRDCATDIRELFPIVQALEAWKVGKELECLQNSMPEEFPVHVLGDYRLVRELGRGGMGIVFEAVQMRSRQRFAVKLLPWKFAADLPQWKERFHREAATIAGLSHPNIVQVHSFGKHSGYFYYVMQLVEGLSLDRVIRLFRETSAPVEIEQVWRDRAAASPERPSSEPRYSGSSSTVIDPTNWQALAQMTAQAALAVAHAHERGVLHNDIKPSNLLVDRRGRLFVSDFAIAKRLEDQLSDREDQAMGTLRYMAPERFHGQCDERSDVYSLGVTLYELLTHQPAFHSRDRQQLVGLILRSRPEAPRRLNKSIPRKLETILLQAMVADREERYQSAAAFAADLTRFANGQFILARRPSWFRRVFSRRRTAAPPRKRR